MASNNNGGQQQNMEIISMISYIEQTIKQKIGEQLKIQLDTNLIQQGMLQDSVKTHLQKRLFNS